MQEESQAKPSEERPNGMQADCPPGRDKPLDNPTVEAFGDTALRVVFGTSISPLVQRQVRNFMARLERKPLPGMIEAVPAFASVTVFYDPLRTLESWRQNALPEAADRLVKEDRSGVYSIQTLAAEWIESLLSENSESMEVESRRVEIPVLYGGEYGPDLEFVADQAGVTPEEVVRIHAERDYPVYMIGFAPGFPYLGGMDERIAAPRLDTPRLSVPAGTVGIAGGQTGIYPVSTPGGWRLIGRTPVALFRPEQMPPSLLRAGDTVRFRPVTAEEYVRLEKVEQTAQRSRAAGREEEAASSVAEVALRGGEKGGHPALTVQKPGLLTTIQDLGRCGYQQYGVTPGGAMDEYALRAANLMIGNDVGEAALEITLTGPTLRFERETLIALTGADLAPSIGGEALPMWRPVRVRAGAVLEFRTAVNGCRAYLALAGGLGVPEALGSRSTDLRAGLGGLEGRALRAADVLHTRTSAGASDAFGPLRPIAPGADFAAAVVHAAHGYLVGRSDWADLPASGFAAPAAAAPGSGRSDPAAASSRPRSPEAAASGAADSAGRLQREWSVSPAAAPKHSSSSSWMTIRVIRGTHFDRFDKQSQQALFNNVFRVDPQSDRMGCRLSGAALSLSQPLEMISEAVAAGTVQVPPGGNPIVLAADRQTTGGYPRIAQVAAVDLRILGQLRPGQQLRFMEITLEEAERLYMERERELEALRIAWNLWRRG
ncbi:hypothetical protein B9G55_12900 [Saccharibacillus sp. O16]|nr:hypothetical protein B9G55_12900 [Saccharibacillus sp. O16]